TMSVPSISALTAAISFSACTHAFTKKPMKPSFTPCFFSKRSRYWVRSAITALMSTSLKVVSMAAVFCASLRRRAMVWRSRDMRTRSSRDASSAGDGARTATGAAGPGGGADSASILVMRPSLPVPAIVAASRPRSAMIFWADGAVPGFAAAGAVDGGIPGLARFDGRGRALGAGIDRTKDRADADGLAVGRGDRFDDSGGRRRHFQRDLVGFEFDQRLVRLHLVADLLEPLAHGRFGDRLAKGRDADFGRHR